MENSKRTFEHLKERFKDLQEDFIKCEALESCGYVYIIATTRQPRKPRQKKWFLWIEPWGTIRFSIFQANPGWSDKDILFTNDPLCKEIALIPESFVKQYNSPGGIRKNILVDQLTNTIFTFLWGEKRTKRALFQTFQSESYVV